MTASLKDVEWQRALDLVLQRHEVVARVEPTGVIRIERKAATK